MEKRPEEHAKPVAHGVLSNAAYEVLRSGVAAMIGWFVGQAAFLKGLETHWIILLVLFAILIVVIIINLIRHALGSPQQLTGEIRGELSLDQSKLIADAERLVFHRNDSAV